MPNEESQDNHRFDVVDVPFHGDSIEAACDTRDGSFHVSIRPVSENLDIDFSRQLRKLKEYHWATVVIMSTVAQDDKQRYLRFCH
jgi:hypothetical protein